MSIYGFRSIGKARLSLQYPGRTGKGVSGIGNVNLILGDNGGGKSSVLRALAITMLAPALLESGFVPLRLVRRPRIGEPDVDHALLKIEAVPGKGEVFPEGIRKRSAELLARIDRRPRGDNDRLHLDSTPDSPIAQIVHDDWSPAFFVVGYGATRWVETGDFSPGSARRSRGLRYRRIASMFEDHVALRPLQSWLPKLRDTSTARFGECVGLVDRTLPDNIGFTGEIDADDQFVFMFEGVPTPFTSLSDGYKAFIGWVGDLIGHLVDVAPQDAALDRLPGIVLVDEIDLHLHPSWQRAVVPTLAALFPQMQFVFTSHSPLIASTVHRENVFVTDIAEDGTATVKQIGESVFGRSAEQLLLSSYFGLSTTRAEAFQDDARKLFRQAAAGSPEAALTYLERLTAPAQASAPRVVGGTRDR